MYSGLTFSQECPKTRHRNRPRSIGLVMLLAPLGSLKSAVPNVHALPVRVSSVLAACRCCTPKKHRANKRLKSEARINVVLNLWLHSGAPALAFSLEGRKPRRIAWPGAHPRRPCPLGTAALDVIDLAQERFRRILWTTGKLSRVGVFQKVSGSAVRPRKKIRKRNGHLTPGLKASPANGSVG